MKSLAFSVMRLAAAFALLGVAVFLTGCTSVADDANHASSRPWNAPKTWEGGLPTGMNEGR